MTRTCKAAMLAIACVLTAPGASALQQPSLSDYDVSGNSGARHKLSAALREVSGLATTSDGRVFAHADENATIIEVDARTGTVRKAFRLGAIAEKGDFEGIAIAGDRFFLVTSQGLIYAAREGQANGAVSFTRHDSGAGSVCEIEGLAYDSVGERLLLPCKNTLRGEFRNRLIVLAVPLRTMRVQPTPVVAVPFGALPGGLRRGVRPTSLEVQPRTRNWILLSSEPAALIELTPQGKVLGTAMLSAKRHGQAEGLTFMPDLTMLITDEGGKAFGTLTSYPARRITP
jgi:uncharacterized protein YjiK